MTGKHGGYKLIALSTDTYRIDFQPCAGGSSAALEAALDNGTPITQAASPLPLALGFIGAIPLTWLQRRARHSLRNRRPKNH